MHRYCSTDPKIVSLSIVPAGIRAPKASSTERLFISSDATNPAAAERTPAPFSPEAQTRSQPCPPDKRS